MRKIQMGWVLDATNSQTTESPRTVLESSAWQNRRDPSFRATLPPFHRVTALSSVSMEFNSVRGPKIHLVCSYLIPDIFFSRSERVSILELRATGFLLSIRPAGWEGSKGIRMGNKRERRVTRKSLDSIVTIFFAIRYAFTQQIKFNVNRYVCIWTYSPDRSIRRVACFYAIGISSTEMKILVLSRGLQSVLFPMKFWKAATLIAQMRGNNWIELKRVQRAVAVL